MTQSPERHILVIDDSEDDFELCARLLQRHKGIRHRVIHARNGEIGLAKIAAEKPDCVLLDYSLPGNNGGAVLSAIRRAHPFLPIVILSGYGGEALAINMMKLGAQNYTSKKGLKASALHCCISDAISECLHMSRAAEALIRSAVILIVDDNADDREACERMLSRDTETDYTIIEACSGDDALEKINTQRPDCVLLDYSLPGRNGLEILSDLVRDRPFLPIIMLTGQGDETLAVRALKQGADNYLIKSGLKAEALQTAIDAALRNGALQKALTAKERAFKKSEQTFALAESVAWIGHWRLDIEDWHPTWSRGIYTIYGWPETQDAPKWESIMRACHEDDRARVHHVFDQAMKYRNDFDIEFRIIRPCGEIRHLRQKGGYYSGGQEEKSHLFGIIQDVTDERKVRVSLDESQKRFETAIDVMSVGVWEWVNTDKEKTWWSAQFQKLLGYEHPELPPDNDTFSTLIHPDDMDSTNAALEAHLNRNMPFETEFRLKTKHDGYRWFLSTGKVIRNEKGKAVRMIGSIKDIHERKRLNRAKNEFVASVNHELRTPMTSINGAISLIRSGVLGSLPDEISELIELAHSNGERLLCLINDLLDMEKIESGMFDYEMRTQNIYPLLRKACGDAAGFARQHDVRVILDHPAEDFLLTVDGSRFEQIMANLLSNAIKFSNAGDTVLVSTEKRDNIIRVNIRDKGPGIPAGFRSRIFDKFSQGDSSSTRRVSGTGLGLAIAKNIVEHFGGKIDFETEIDVGTNFYFELPIIEENSRDDLNIFGKTAQLELRQAAG